LQKPSFALGERGFLQTKSASWHVKFALQVFLRHT